MNKKWIALCLSGCAMLFTACQAQKEAQLPDGMADQLVAHFEEYWHQEVPAGTALAEGHLFFADLDGNAFPELYITYSAGMGKQTGLLAFAAQGDAPELLGNAYLAVPPAGEEQELAFTLWGEGQARVLHTEGIIPTGVANLEQEYIESFLSLSEGRLVLRELAYTVLEDEVIYYNGTQDRERVSQQEYEAIRDDYLASAEPLTAVETSDTLSFLEEPDAFARAISDAFAQWSEEQTA